MLLRALGHFLFFHIIYVSINNLQAERPKINTQYLRVGHLHPRIDFAGVLINLNVAAAIKRGNQSIELANKYLDHNRSKQKIAKWTGQYRHIHFMTMKRNRVLQNLRMLEADLHQVHEQYRINLPGKDTSIDPSSISSSRPKRGINFDIEFDVNRCLSTVFNGIVSLFSAPKSLDKIQKSVEKISYRTSRLESEFSNFTTQIDLILHMMQSEMDSNIDKFHMVASINSALSLADDTIMELLTSITPLIQGKLTHNLLDPLQAKSLMAETQKLADRFNLHCKYIRCKNYTF